MSDTLYSTPLNSARRLLRALRAASELLSDGRQTAPPSVAELNSAARLVDYTLEVPEPVDQQSDALRTLQYRASCEAQLLVHGCRTVAAMTLGEYPIPELVDRLRAQRWEAEFAVNHLLDAIALTLATAVAAVDDPAVAVRLPGIADYSARDYRVQAHDTTQPAPLQTMAELQADGGTPPSVTGGLELQERE